eukprot:5852075-Prymnesium_polylepis.1
MEVGPAADVRNRERAGVVAGRDEADAAVLLQLLAQRDGQVGEVPVDLVDDRALALALGVDRRILKLAAQLVVLELPGLVHPAVHGGADDHLLGDGQARPARVGAALAREEHENWPEEEVLAVPRVQVDLVDEVKVLVGQVTLGADGVHPRVDLVDKREEQRLHRRGILHVIRLDAPAVALPVSTCRLPPT